MATAYICPMCVFNCDNLPDLEQHLEAHESNALQSPARQQPHATKAVRNSPLYAKAPAPSTNRSPVQHSHSLANSSPNKTYERRYACKSCPFSTHSVKAYFNHRQVAHGEQLLITECPFCDYASQYPGKVKKHLTDEHPMQQTPNDEPPVQSTRSSARGNSINHTIELNGKASVDAAGTKFTDCPFCSFTSNDSDAFRQHVLTNHLSDKNFRCLVCNRLYRYRGDCSYHIRKKHSDRMIGDNLESLREYVGEFQPNTMSIHELKELLACPLTPSLASVPSNGTPTQVRQPLPQQPPQPSTNSTHGFRCGYCAFSSANSGDVKKHQTWKHAHLPSNILPIDPNDAAQQAVVSSKRKRVQSTKLTNNDEDGPVVRRPRISMPAQRQLTIDTSAPGNGDYESAPRDLLSPNEPTPSAMDFELASKKSSTPTHQPSVTASASSRIYKCLRCERLAPHRWIIERHIRAKHPSDSDTLDEVIVEVEKPSTPSSATGEPKMATKASLASEPDNASSPVPKAFSCSACSLQSYNLWVILRHIRNVHENDGSNAKIIDNINNQIIEDNDDRSANSVSSNTPTTTASTDENDESESQRNEADNEEMLKHLINTAMASRKANAPNAFLENLPASLANNNVAASLATLLGQLTNKQLLQQQQQQQQQCQAEKAPLAKRYKCSLCSHVSAWGGNVKKHLKRMHPGDYSGHVIDLGAELAVDEAIGNQRPSLSTRDELDEPQILSTNTNKLSLANDKTRHSYPHSLDLINTKLKDIDNAPSFAPPTSTNSSQSTRPERLYGCSACSYECTNPSNIHRHVEVHCGEDGGGFQCSQCFFLSKWRASIRKHMISAHGSSLASLTNVLEPLIISKSTDATAVVKKWLIHENGNKHEDDPNNNSTHTVDASTYYCASCPYTNNNRASFEQHVVNHNVSKRDTGAHTCSFCSFNSAEKEAFDDHQMLHILKEDFHDDVTANAVENTVV